MTLVPLEPLDLPGRRDFLVQLDLLGQLEVWVSLAEEGLVEFLDKGVRLEIRDLLVRSARKVVLGLQVTLARLDQLVSLVVLDSLDPRDLKDSEDLPEPQVNLGLLEFRVMLVPLGQ